MRNKIADQFKKDPNPDKIFDQVKRVPIEEGKDLRHDMVLNDSKSGGSKRLTKPVGQMPDVFVESLREATDLIGKLGQYFTQAETVWH